jgi:hypothetical protein
MSVCICALRRLAPVPPSVTQYSEGWLGLLLGLLVSAENVRVKAVLVSAVEGEPPWDEDGIEENSDADRQQVTEGVLAEG